MSCIELRICSKCLAGVGQQAQQSRPADPGRAGRNGSLGGPTAQLAKVVRIRWAGKLTVSGVYSKPAMSWNRTFTSMPVVSLGSSAMASLQATASSTALHSRSSGQCAVMCLVSKARATPAPTASQQCIRAEGLPLLPPAATHLKLCARLARCSSLSAAPRLPSKLLASSR